MSRRVEGAYKTIDEALAAVKRLRESGYGADEIALVANSEVRSAIMPGKEDIKISDSFDEAYNESSYAYREEVDRGSVVVVVEDREATVDHDGDHDRAPDGDRDNQTIELREEQLDVDTTKVQTGEVRVSKHVVEEKETVVVPVSHVEVTFESHPVTGRRVAEGDWDFTDTEEVMVIPITEEQIVVKKGTEVVEEVAIHKKAVTEEKQITETVRREELDVDATGNVTIDGNQPGSDREDPNRPL